MTYSPEMIYYMGGHAPLNIIVIWDEALLDQVVENNLGFSDQFLIVNHNYYRFWTARSSSQFCRR